MLGALKSNLITSIKLQGLEVKKAELDFYIMRYYAVASLSTFLVGTAYVGLIKIKFPEHMHETVEEYFEERYLLRERRASAPDMRLLHEHHASEHSLPHEHHGETHELLWPWQISAFFISISSTLALGLLNLFLIGYLVVGAQGMILRGPPGSLPRCVTVLRGYWLPVRLLLGASLASLVASILSIMWMKLEDAPRAPASAVLCTLLFAGVLLGALLQMRRMMETFAIPSDKLVRGDTTVATVNARSGKTERIDLSGEHELL